MSKEIESVAAALFDKIRSRFPNVTLGNESAKATSDPEKARFFNFTYTNEDGAEFGKVTISLIDETSLKVYFGQNIGGDMDREQRKEWYLFLRNLRKFAKRNLLTFDTRDINKSNLELQDVKQQAKTDNVYTATNSETMNESRLYGTSRNSYADIDECRLLIKHEGLVSDEIRGARSRRIRDIFIETPIGERLHVPFKNLHGARAMCRHINEGGQMHDEIGECITNMVQEMSSMSHFVRATKNRQFEDQETAGMAQAATQHYLQLKANLRHLASKRHYREFVETFLPAENPLEDIDIDALRERFVKKVYDDRFTEALPAVYRAYKKYKTETADQLGNELSEWADEVTESTWAEPDNDDKIRALQELLKSPLLVGIDGIDAQTKIQPIIGDDELNSAIYDISRDQGPDADATGLIKSWLEQHDPAVFSKLKSSLENTGRDSQTNFPQPTSPQASVGHEYGETPAHSNVSNIAYEDADPLDFIRSLAGLVK